MNVSIFSKMAYENKSHWTLGENKPNSNPNKPNFRKGKIDAKCVFTKDYRKKDDFAVRKNKPNSNPISVKPKMSANVFVTKDYENENAIRLPKNKPNQSQFQKPISAPKERQENNADKAAHRRHEYQSSILRTGFIRRFFSLTIRFFTHLGVEFGFDYLFGPGCLYGNRNGLLKLPLESK